jgi:hypothetical protein
MNEQIREPIIDVERGTIQFHGGPEMLIVPKTLDISVEKFFDLEMPEWLRQLLDENQAQAKEIERYADWEKSVNTALGYATELQSLREENARYREALEWYAGGRIYSNDDGKRARNALIGSQKEKE